jgi:hypothetical protein
MQLNWKQSESTQRPLEVDTTSTTSGVYLRRNIAETETDGVVKYSYDEVLLPSEYKYDIADVEEYLAKLLQEFKAQKQAESDTKNKTVEFIKTSYGKLKTTTPVGELTTVMNSLAIIVQMSGNLQADMVRFYLEDGSIVGNQELNQQQFAMLFSEVITAYKAIDNKSTMYKKAIQEAETLEELENIEINYEM